jgi:hypothetical protein
MSSRGTIVFRGRSGEQYRFQIWPLGTRFKALGAVCLLSKRSHKNRNFAQTASHECIHIGQTADLSALSYDASCFKDADCICVYLSQSEEHRTAVENDLIDSLGTWNAKFRVDLSSVAPPAVTVESVFGKDDSAERPPSLA